MKRELIKYINMNCPTDIVDYFEEQARAELKEEGEQVHMVSLGRKRNELVISALRSAIERYERIG